ncbi:hypothetical protein ACWDZ6_06325 [Streptomyces sp. NPDC002926]
MSRGLGVVQRRILETLKRIEESAPGAWVRFCDLVSPKEGQKIERSDHQSTARAVRTLAQRGLVETRSNYAWYARKPIVRLIKAGRPPLLDLEEDRKTRMRLAPQISKFNDTLRTQRSRIRVEVVDLGKFEYITVIDSETGKSYRAVHLY